MITPEEFVARCEYAIDSMALLCAHSPDDAMTPHMERFRTNVTANWAEIFKGAFSPAEIAEVVDYMVGRIEARRREIEAMGAGMA